MFGSYEVSKHVMGVKSEQDFSHKQSLGSSAISSVISMPIINAAELVKCRMQIQRSKPTADFSSSTQYRHSLDCAVKITRSEGLKGLTTGLFATGVRDVPGIVAYFHAYFLSKRAWCSFVSPGPVENISYLGILVSGSVVGIAGWGVSYPCDVIKT